MRFRTSLLFICLRLYAVDGAAIFQWPDPQLDHVDDTLYTTNNFLSFLTKDCITRDNSTVAAQWIRLAYHDMSTHDVSDGSGGLDASMLFEMDRPQNVGEGMNLSFGDFDDFTKPNVGLADIIALGTVLAVASCGGPVIPFRAGRIDAKVAGPATVPEPHQGLQSHIANFARQGFTQTEMISLIACGHTLGGVRRVDFPTIVDNSAIGVASFDGTNKKFDNTGVNEYLAGTTGNPLVTTSNVTTRSDLRIFSSDGNVTMQSMASPESFSNTCKNLFERMINTVPKEVKLTEPLTDPIENKVNEVALFTKNGNYTLRATLRRNTVNSNRKVKIFWQDRQLSGSAICPPAGCSADVTLTTQIGPNYLGVLRGITIFTAYRFTIPIALNSSVSKFWFTVDEADGSGAKLVDNQGLGFVFDQDTVLYNRGRAAFLGSLIALVVGVRTTELGQTPTLSIESFEPGGPGHLPIIQTVNMKLDPKNPPAEGYTYFTANVSVSVQAVHVNADVGGKQYRIFVDSTDFIF